MSVVIFLPQIVIPMSWQVITKIFLMYAPSQLVSLYFSCRYAAIFVNMWPFLSTSVVISLFTDCYRVNVVTDHHEGSFWCTRLYNWLAYIFHADILRFSWMSSRSFLRLSSPLFPQIVILSIPEQVSWRSSWCTHRYNWLDYICYPCRHAAIFVNYAKQRSAYDKCKSTTGCTQLQNSPVSTRLVRNPGHRRCCRSSGCI